MSKLTTIVSFIIGASSGAASMFFGIKKYYSDKAEKEISESRETFRNILRSERSKNKKETTCEKIEVAENSEIGTNGNPPKNKLTYQRLIDTIKKCGYSISEESENTTEPYEIPEEVYDDSENYHLQLIWYNISNVLADAKDGYIYDEIEDLIGEFGTGLLCNNDTPRFFVRNERLHTDIMVVIDDDNRYEDEQTFDD